MTEIPEHLLKRAAERRAAKSGEPAPAAAPAADAPAAAAGDAPAAVAPAKKAAAPLPTLDDAPERVVPDIPVVAAAKRRKRVPFWAASVLALLPLWGFVYVYSIQPPPAGASDPMVIGKAVYDGSCASCHKADGAGAAAGGVGQQLSDGHVLKTFADPLAVAHWVHYGAAQGARADGTYGDLTREGGPMNVADLSGVMSPFPDLDPKDMAALIIYIREGLSGGVPADDPNFNAEKFVEDPDKLAAMVEAATALPPGGDPDIASIDGAETAAP